MISLCPLGFARLAFLVAPAQVATTRPVLHRDRRTWRVWTLLSALLTAASPAFAQIEGYGKDATGGAGKPVCTVTSSAAQGSGTWDSCVSNGGNQIIQFAVPIATVYRVSYLRSNTTVDGCANGQNGVTLDLPANDRRAVVIEGPASNVIVRCIRFQGSGPKKAGFDFENDLLALDGESGLVSKVVVDRCTFVGSTDGAFDITGNVSDVTGSFNLLYGTPLTQLIKYDTRQRISLHHNVYTAGGERNPQIKGDARDIDFVSNAVYNQTISSDPVGNSFSPYGTWLRNAGSGSDSPGNVKANLRSNFYGGANSDLEIDTESGASATGIYIAPDNVCAGGCPASPAGTPNAVPAAYAVTATPVNCMASLMLPTVGSPNRTSTDQAKLDAVGAALPGGCGGSSFTLTVAKAGTGTGTVTSSPAGINCGADCTEPYASGTVVTLSQTATAGSSFAGWTGACTGTGACSVTMSAAKSVTATFNLVPNTLTVTKAGTGTGTVTSSPTGINCGADCTEPYASGTVVTLSQTATAGSSFAGWTGACTGTGACSVTMSAAKSVTATFNLVPNTLTVTKAGTGTGTVTSSPTGINCGADCTEPYTPGTVVTLSQTATAGSSFAGWTGACTGTGACSVTMDAAKSVTATFNLVPNTLTVTKAGTGAGTVTSSPVGINCGADCTEPYTSGTVVTLSQAATAGSSFAGWTGACTGTGACSVTMSAAKSVTATFNLVPNTLTVTKAGTGTGTVTSSPTGINCGADCTEPYTPGTVVTLSQTATAGSSFAGWTGACTGTGACSVTLDAAKSVTATFNLVPNTLTVTKAGTGTGTVTSSPVGINCGADCTEPYTSGTVVTLSQAATAGSSFAGWTGACTGTGACSVTMSAAKSVTATFNLVPNTLTVTKAGTGTGTVTSSPTGINCGADCTEPYTPGTVVTLSQTATAGSSFAGWTGACTGTGACSVTLDAAKSVTATFNLVPNTLTVTKAGTGTGTVTSSPVGINCGADCTEPYASGTVVTLSQAATAGSSFAGWTGACTGTGACSVTMSAAKSVTATFNLVPNTLTVTKAGTGTGTVTSSPAGINCGADCSEPYAPGTVVTLSQTGTAGSSFAGWTGACTGTGACSVTMDAAKAVTATFNAGLNNLSVTKAGNGAGTVTSTPAGISCGTDCTEGYTAGTIVTLTKSATAGSTFAGWSGACTGTGACQVTVDGAKSVTATFDLTTYTLTLSKLGTGSGTVASTPAGVDCGADCTEAYTSGTVVTLTSTPSAGSTFTGWGGGCTGTGTCQVTMSAARSITASFKVIPHTYTVTKAGTGTGTVTSSPAGINCGATCSAPFNPGTLVSLVRTASSGSTFMGWSGACTGTGTCQVTMDAAKAVTATFDLTPYTLTVTRLGTGSGTVTSTPAGISCGADCTEPFTSGTVVTLSQTASAGSTFTGWGGACTGTGACQVTMSAAKSVTAAFNPTPNSLSVVKAGTGTGTVTSSPAGISCGADCSQTYASGAVVTLSKTAASGSSFAGWSGACTGTGACQVTMSAARSVTANFNSGAGIGISVSDASVTEGNAGSMNAAFAVNLSAASPVSVSVGYTVSSLTAGPGDFTASSGTLTFPPGAVAQSLVVPVQGDVLAEANETFVVTLVSSSEGIFTDSQGVGTIVNDDALPSISIVDASVTEDDAGQQAVFLRVSLSALAGLPVKVRYSTANQTALAVRDYLSASGSLLFPEGTTAGELALWVSGDLATEATETFTVNLTQPEGASIAKGAATVTILDNDTTPALSVADVRVTEGHVASRNAAFRVTLAASAPADVSFSWATADLTAKAGEDYLPSTGTIVIPKGYRMAIIYVPVLGDATDERNEAFLFRVSNPTGARIIDGQAQGVIWDDDGEKDLATPIASLPYVATTPGPYRLTGDLSFAPAQGAAVTVAANGVVLDLDGRTLSGSAGAATEAIGVLSRSRSTVTVENGKVQGFLAGVFLAGPPTLNSKFAVRNLRVHSSTYAGIWLEGRGNVVDACEVVGTGGTTALDPGAGAVGISSVGAAPKLTLNQVRDTVAPNGGDAFGIAADAATSGILSGNLVKNTSPFSASGILVTRAKKASVTLNTLETLDYGIVFTGEALGTCQGNNMTAVSTPTMGVTCEP